MKKKEETVNRTDGEGEERKREKRDRGKKEGKTVTNERKNPKEVKCGVKEEKYNVGGRERGKLSERKRR